MNTLSKLPTSALPEVWNSKEAWRVFGIMSEFVSATDRLNRIHPAVSIFGRSSPAAAPASWKPPTRARSTANRPASG